MVNDKLLKMWITQVPKVRKQAFGLYYINFNFDKSHKKIAVQVPQKWWKSGERFALGVKE